MRRIAICLLVVVAVGTVPAQAENHRAYPCAALCGMTEAGVPIERDGCGPQVLDDTYLERGLTVYPYYRTAHLKLADKTDWDMFVCATDGRTLAIAANLIGDDCDGIAGENTMVPVGCAEEIALDVGNELSIIVRAFNIADPDLEPDTWTFNGYPL